MESERFDELIRTTFSGASRRGVLGVGIGAVAATALAILGHDPSAVDAKKNKKKRCPSNRPIKCGNGCCPSNFSKCCDNAAAPVNSFTCNPSDFTCCPIEEGGGSCDPERPQCCPATDQDPFGSCAAADDTCCPSEQGGGSCSADEPICCGQIECCEEGQSCCGPDGECPPGTVCESGEEGGCCIPEDLPISARRKASSRRVHHARFHKKAK